MIDDIDSPYASIPSLKAAIYARGLDRARPESKQPANRSGEPLAMSLKYELRAKADQS
jgi:hypothetical protein